MNSTSLDLNASETLANKSLVVTTILVSLSYLIVTKRLWWVDLLL